MLLSYLSCGLLVAYTPAMAPRGLASQLLVPRVDPLQFANDHPLTDPAIATEINEPPLVPRLLCTAISQLGTGVERVARGLERFSVFVSNGAGNLTGTLAWLVALIACSPLFLLSSTMACIGRTARTLAERSYATATGGVLLPASATAAPKATLVARMQADIDKGRADRAEGQRLAVEQMLQRSTIARGAGAQPIAAAAPPAPPAPQPASSWGAASSLEKRYDRVMRQQSAPHQQGARHSAGQSPFPSANLKSKSR